MKGRSGAAVGSPGPSGRITGMTVQTRTRKSRHIANETQMGNTMKYTKNS